MSDRFYLGVSPDERIGYDACDPSGLRLKQKLCGNVPGYSGPFKLRIEPGTSEAEIRAFFPEDVDSELWWPAVDDFRIYYGSNPPLEPKTIEELLSEIREADYAA